MMGMPRNSVADEVVSSVGSYVSWEGRVVGVLADIFVT